MIITKKVWIQLNSNQIYDSVKYWSEKGYFNLRPQQKLLVNVGDLPSFSSAKVLFKCDDCGVEWERRFSKRNAKRDYEKDLCYKCSRLDIGKRVGKENAIKGGKKNRGENHHNYNPNKKEYSKYAYEVRRITEETYRQNIHILNPDNHPRTLNGVCGGYQLDHKISIKSAFLDGLDPKIVGSIENLQMLPWEDNRKKW